MYVFIYVQRLFPLGNENTAGKKGGYAAPKKIRDMSTEGTEAKSVSVREAIALSSYLKAEKRVGAWHVSNKKKRTMSFFESLGIEVPATLDEFLLPKRKVMTG